jgi:hypothetical protein
MPCCSTRFFFFSSPEYLFFLFLKAYSDLIIIHVRIPEPGMPLTGHLFAESAVRESFLFYTAGIHRTGVNVNKISPEDRSPGISAPLAFFFKMITVITPEPTDGREEPVRHEG